MLFILGGEKERDECAFALSLSVVVQRECDERRDVVVAPLHIDTMAGFPHTMYIARGSLQKLNFTMSLHLSVKREEESALCLYEAFAICFDPCFPQNHNGAPYSYVLSSLPRTRNFE